jgi:hypothetical protein
MAIARSKLNAHEHAMQAPIAQVVRELVAFLGAPTVAAIAGVKETRAVQQWTSGREPQRAHVLRFALQLASMLAQAGDRSIAKAWFYGSNPALGGFSPLALFRTKPLGDIQVDLLNAAQSFSQREEQ